MNFLSKHKLAFVTVSYWFLLVYILAALCWWFIALTNQNNNIAQLALSELNKDDIEYVKKIEKINEFNQRKTTQYIGEGVTFLAVILVGAIFIFRATRRQLKFSERQQNFMMAVTHELKTPIAVTQLNLETLKKRKLEPQQQEKIINDSLIEVARLNNLCNNSLWAAQLDFGSYTSNYEKLNLSSLINDSVTKYSNRFSEYKFSSVISENIFLNSDILMMEILINNLLENAIKYSPRNNEIIVELNNIKNKIGLRVVDFGYGIKDADKEKIFSKFYRSNQSNSSSTTGSGLGLFLCKKIMDKHNGTIKVKDNKPSGSIFELTFNV